MTKQPAKKLDEHIEITPNICGGKPRIAGRRITVEQIAVWHDRMARNADEIATEFDIELADVHAALAYYFDHQNEIDESIRQSQDWIEEIKAKTPSLVRQKLQLDSANGGQD